MFTYAVIFLIISLVAGAVGLTNLSAIAKRIAFILFALFFLLAAIVFGLAFVVGEAVTGHSWLIPAGLAVAAA